LTNSKIAGKRAFAQAVPGVGAIPRLTSWQIGVACSRDCRAWAIENLSPDEYRAYIIESLEFDRREADRLLYGEALRAARQAAEE
jgi:hypothetical protein